MKSIKLADTKASEDKLAKQKLKNLRELKLDEAWKLGEVLKKNNTINLFWQERHKISAFSPVLLEEKIKQNFKNDNDENQDFKNELAELLAKYDLIVSAEKDSESTISEFFAYRSRDELKFALGQGLVSPVELADDETLKKLGYLSCKEEK